MSPLEASDRAKKIWGESAKVIQSWSLRNFNGAIIERYTVETSGDNIGWHQFDENGHPICHAHCDDLERENCQ